MNNVGRDAKVYKQSAARKFRLSFKQNRSFELTVKGVVIFFAPYGSQIVDEWVIANMTDQEKLFFNMEAIDAN